MLDSHLDGDEDSGPKRLDTSHRNVFRPDEIDALAGEGVGRQAHGSVVSQRQVAPDRVVGGSRGDLADAPGDPRARMYTQRGLPAEAANWEGSSTIYRNNELPPTTPDGRGFHGSASIVSNSDLERIDSLHGTGVAPAASLVPEEQELDPGAYQLSDGSVLLVNPAGQRQVVSQEQFQQLMHRVQSRPPSILNRVMGAIRR